jgi:hypothetical protein
MFGITTTYSLFAFEMRVVKLAEFFTNPK